MCLPPCTAEPRREDQRRTALRWRVRCTEPGLRGIAMPRRSPHPAYVAAAAYLRNPFAGLGYAAPGLRAAAWPRRVGSFQRGSDLRDRDTAQRVKPARSVTAAQVTDLRGSATAVRSAGFSTVTNGGRERNGAMRCGVPAARCTAGTDMPGRLAAPGLRGVAMPGPLRGPGLRAAYVRRTCGGVRAAPASRDVIRRPAPGDRP